MLRNKPSLTSHARLRVTQRRSGIHTQCITHTVAHLHLKKKKRERAKRVCPYRKGRSKCHRRDRSKRRSCTNRRSGSRGRTCTSDTVWNTFGRQSRPCRHTRPSTDDTYYVIHIYVIVPILGKVNAEDKQREGGRKDVELTVVCCWKSKDRSACSQDRRAYPDRLVGSNQDPSSLLYRRTSRP